MSESHADTSVTSTAEATTTGRRPPMLKRLFTQRSFVAAAGVLACAALAFNVGTQVMDVYFKKQAVPLRQVLDDPDHGIPSKLGSWVKVSEQASLNPDVEHSLGTNKFVFRVYANGAAIGEEAVAELTDRDEDEAKVERRRKLMGRLMMEQPNAFVSFAVTYYTGLVDTVAHVPDRCMVADGYDVRPGSYVVEPFGTTMPDGTRRDLEYRFITFEDQTGRGRTSRNVLYFFHCNGDYVDGPLGVRLKLQNLLERHAYYAKVEMMTDEVLPRGIDIPEEQRRQARDEAVNAMTGLLAEALPEIERCLPDWKQVKANAAAAPAAVAAK